MKKSARINDMMIYLNDKDYFNLKDLMERYKISKSTALRDIESLEEIGMPIFSELGRYGRYGILKNKLLAPIVFTVDEMYALYFAMITLDSYESTPFHLSTGALRQKFEACLSEEQRHHVRKMKELLSFDVSKHPNSSPFLKKILQMAIEEQLCELSYNKKGAINTYYIQFFDISAKYGQWYATGYNYAIKSIRVFRCDKILSLKESTAYETKPLNELMNHPAVNFRQKNAIDFEIGLKSSAVDLFYKEHYPSMKLIKQQEEYVLKGFFHPGEENFITDYLLNYTDKITWIKPLSLKKLLQGKLTNLEYYYKSL